MKNTGVKWVQNVSMGGGDCMRVYFRYGKMAMISVGYVGMVGVGRRMVGGAKIGWRGTNIDGVWRMALCA